MSVNIALLKKILNSALDHGNQHVADVAKRQFWKQLEDATPESLIFHDATVPPGSYIKEIQMKYEREAHENGKLRAQIFDMQERLNERIAFSNTCRHRYIAKPRDYVRREKITDPELLTLLSESEVDTTRDIINQWWMGQIQPDYHNSLLTEKLLAGDSDIVKATLQKWWQSLHPDGRITFSQARNKLCFGYHNRKG